MAAKKKADKEKPLDKMTVIELRDIAKQIEGVVGVHGMNKAELLTAVREERGITEPPKAKGSVDAKQVKSKIKSLKLQRGQALVAKDKAMATRYRRQISRLKKQTRRDA
ncbi:MAG: transcription termination factor Rho [Desulfatitalea sp.]|nr:transcription termination factor Rho [Desulfatitalea sp.]